ncbi:MAG: DUF1622 domain-containing protein [Sphingomicrobium sp.]|nr:DUF1622 domain-containing protein [Sphingomonadales bacterium]
MFETAEVDIVRIVTHLVEIVGVAIIALGAFGTLLRFLTHFLAGSATRDRDEAVAAFRSNLGRSILLGLEFLVAADIINTVAVTPTLISVAVLAGIVAIRTFLSFSLELEIEGRWPWQRRAGQDRQV